ncbi:hypothetical protein FRC01_010326, partial [Tulasnella sp. 417]
MFKRIKRALRRVVKRGKHREEGNKQQEQGHQGHDQPTQDARTTAQHHAPGQTFPGAPNLPVPQQTAPTAFACLSPSSLGVEASQPAPPDLHARVAALESNLALLDLRVQLHTMLQSSTPVQPLIEERKLAKKQLVSARKDLARAREKLYEERARGGEMERTIFSLKSELRAKERAYDDREAELVYLRLQRAAVLAETILEFLRQGFAPYRQCCFAFEYAFEFFLTE